MSAHQTRMWIFGLAAFVLTITIAQVAGAAPYVSALSGALAMVAAVLTVRITSGDPDANARGPHRRPQHGEPLPVRVRASQPRGARRR